VSSILDYSPNETKGGDELGHPDQVSDVFDIVKSSPDKGKIRVRMKPKSNVSVGDAYQTKVSLSAPGQNLEEIFWVKIGKPNRGNSKSNRKSPEPDLENFAGLPELVPVFRSPDDGEPTWDDVESSGAEMDYQTVMHPQVEEDRLESILVNMDSQVLLNYKSGQRGEEAIQIAENRYLSSVYFHTLFLYTITKNRGYRVYANNDEDAYSNPEEVDLESYLKALFDSHYSEFLLNFETSELIEALED